MTLARELQVVAESFGDLVASHLHLARLEVQDDACWIGKRLAIVLGLAPLVVVGYALLCAAAALVLEQAVSLPVALGTIGLANLLVGTVGILAAANQLRHRELLVQTVVELETSSTTLVRTAGATP